MNKTLRDSANNLLRHLVSKLNINELQLFKKIYSHSNMDLDIESIIINIKDDSISHAITLCENTIYGIKNNG